MPLHKTKCWCFTNYDLFYKWNMKYFSYHTYQIEQCPKTGRRHQQGYFELHKAEDFDGIRDILKSNMHIEARKGNGDQAIEYCHKSETRVEGPFTHGTPKQQGKRNDLINIRDRIKNGDDMLDIASDNFNSFLRYSRGFERYRQLLLRPRTQAPKVVVIIGPAGIGKTRFVYDNHKSVYPKNPHNKWWCGYNGQEAILLDECDWNRFDREELLKLTDRYPYIGETKGGQVHINSPYIYLTSNHDLMEHTLYDPSVARRISELKYMYAQ